MPALSMLTPPPLRLGSATQGPASSSGGDALHPEVKGPIEQSFGVSLDSVRVHSDGPAQSAARSFGARAFAFGKGIFLGRGERPTDLGLMAHEAAHVVQQQGQATIQRMGGEGGDSFEGEAHRASAAVVHGETFAVRERTANPRVQRFGVSDVLDYFADKANIIPGFRMFTIILGLNPINMSKVDRSAANILRAVVEFIPGGGLITQALDNYGIFDKAGKWVEEQIQTLGMVGSSFKKAISDFIDSLSWRDIFHLGDVWDRAKRIFTDPIIKIISFVKGLVLGFLGLIRDALLRPLAKLAEGTQGWDLLKAVLGQDPITGDPVPQNAETLIGGFMKLIGQEEIWNNIKKANALARAWAWFQGALSGLLGFVKQVPSLIIQTIRSIELMDIVLLPRVFIKIGTAFVGFLGKFISWAGETIWSLLQIIFEVVAPAVIPYLKKVAASFRKILKDPIGFVKNLIQAGKQGFQNFASNIGTHLKAAFIEWLTGSLPGVYIPKALELKEIVKFVLSVLGLTWDNIRQKLVKAIGEPAVKVLETAFDIVVTLVKEGPAAAWDKIKEQLANLKDMVMQGIMDYIIETVVKKAVAKVLSLLVPGGAFIQAIISIYDTVMVFIDKLKKIIQVVKSFLDSIMEIADGVVGAAAAKIESTLAGLLVLAISFLAGFLGLGKIADKVMNIINTKVRAPIDKALDFLVSWIVKAGKAILGKAKGAAGKLLNWWKEKKSLSTGEGEAHSMYFSGEGPAAKLVVASTPIELYEFLKSKADEAKKDTKKKEALDAIKPLMKTIESLSKLPEDQQQAKEADFKNAFNAIGTQLVILLSSGSWGTETNPLPLEYTKRRAAAYPIIYVGPKAEGRIPQNLLVNNSLDAIEALLTKDEKKDWIAKGRPIIKCAPLARTPLPDGGPTIGVTPEYDINVGKKLNYRPDSTEGGGKINKALRPYGYVARINGGEGNDGDHVVEMQLGGPNILENLWPLVASENRSSGSLLSKATVKKPDGKEIGIKDAYKQKSNKLWLVVVKTI